jgi:hypothetical protein
MSLITDRDVTAKLFSDIGPRYAERHGGHLLILKLGPRPGDSAPMARIELVEGVSPLGEPVRRGTGRTVPAQSRHRLRRHRLSRLRASARRPDGRRRPGKGAGEGAASPGRAHLRRPDTGVHAWASASLLPRTVSGSCQRTHWPRLPPTAGCLPLSSGRRSRPHQRRRIGKIYARPATLPLAAACLRPANRGMRYPGGIYGITHVSWAVTRSPPAVASVET